MRSTLLGLSVPLLLFAAAFATAIPEASAQADDEYFEVSGRVLSDGGEPLQGVRINAYTYPDHDGSEDAKYASYSVYRGGDAATDNEGRYTLKLAAGRGYINVYYDEWRLGDGRELVVDGHEENVDFTLVAPPPKTAIIQGTVVDPNGNPVAGAQVNLGSTCCYAMPGIPTPPPMAEPAVPEDTTTEESGNVTTAQSDNATSADAGNSSAPVEGASGGGASGSSGSADVDDAYYSQRIRPPYHDDSQSTVTDENGEFTFRAYGGPRQITAWAKGFAQTTLEVTAVDGETTQVEVELEKVPPRDAVLEGRLVDAQTGLPVANAHVSARSLEWGRHAEAQTDKEGRYRLQTVPGWTEISVNLWGYADPAPMPIEADGIAARPLEMATPKYYPEMLVIDLQSGANEREIELDPKPRPTIALVGYVVDPEAKKGVEGARVSVWNHETGDWGEAVTDRTGSFKILVREGHYSATAWKEGHLAGTQTFVVTDDATQRVDLLLPRGTQKWAPCYDESDCGPVMYDAMYARSSHASPTPAIAAIPEGGAGMAATDEAATRSAAAPPAPQAADTDARGEPSFPGEGGGLPEYDPNAANELPATQQQTGPSEIPGAGLLALLAALGVLALAVRRRR